ncbi:MAG: methyltransferase domain-containing protein [Elusimicrobia bacterium]|nr:methyltransferase domain-containing protein [Elusimicrobiota bacterium]
MMKEDNNITLIERLRRQLESNNNKQQFSRVYDEYNKYLLDNYPVTINKNTYLYRANVSTNPAKRFIVQYILSGSNVLELGIGDGTLSAALAHNNNDVIGIDVSSFAIDRANLRFSHIQDLQFQHMDARWLQFPDQTFDYVIGLDVIGHLPFQDISDHIREVKRVLKTNGSYFVWTVFRCMGENEDGLHLKVYSLRELTDLFHNIGFNVTLYDVRFIIFNAIFKILESCNGLVYWYEKLLSKTCLGRWFKNSRYSKWLIMPPCMIKARKIS